MRFPNLVAVGLSVVLLTGCSATKTAIQKHNLHVETRMSETIFLEPVPPEHRVIYVQVRNTSDRMRFDIAPQVETALRNKGYRLTRDPEDAYLMLQANVLRVEKMDAEDSQRALLGGYGETLGGAAIGGVIGHQLGNHSAGGAIAGAAIGAVVTTVSNAFVTDDTYTAVTDIQVSQRPKGGLPGEWDRYETRIVSSANQANLNFVDAEQPLADGVTHALAGMF